ncbi:MAG: patatin-like phospholipase family protein [Hyphomicrobiaceae bacterium]|nr:patatin-like phospholipase family protein [Hyphomicrobiaceae bacterium]
MGLFKRARRINLALQGGGAHGAFTWGVLDRLLEDESLELGWVSGTSAGAVNAVALAAGLAEGGRAGARARLKAVWDSVYRAGVPDLLRLNPFLFSLARSPTMAHMASLWSPYEFNPMGFDPLRRLLAENIDFEALRMKAPVGLIITATDIATGRPRHFRRHEITIETILASACLPTLHHAVVIDGRAYWDGGFSANPDLVTLVQESGVGDTLLVLLNPVEKLGIPTGVREIADHANRLTFNAPLLRDIEVIATARRAPRPWFGGGSDVVRLADHRFHMIEAGRYTAQLRPDSKVKPDLEMFRHLFGAGQAEAGKWLERQGPAVGQRETVDLPGRFLSADPAATAAPATPSASAGAASSEAPSRSGPMDSALENGASSPATKRSETA